MAPSDLKPRQRVELDQAIRRAESSTRVELSVFVGSLGPDSRDQATRMHAVLAAPDVSILLAVDPRTRAVEIVTGAAVRSRVTDSHARKVIAQMRAAAQQGDRTGNLVAAVESLTAGAAR